MSVLKYWDTNTSSWQVAIVGAQGATGATGPSGSTGATGPTGTTLSNGTSNVEIPNVSGNINFTSNGITTLVITDIGAVLGNGTGGDLTGGNLISANSIDILAAANFTSASNVSLGNVGNLKISGGSNGQYLQTNGNGTLSWSTVDGIANGNSSISIPASAGNINVSVNGNANIATFTGTGLVLTGTLSITNNNEQQQFTGTRTIVDGNPYPSSAPNNTPTVVWTSSTNSVNAFLMTIRIQNSGEVEILELMAAMNAAFGVSFTETNRVNTNPAILDTLVNVVSDPYGYMQVILTPKDGSTVYVTYSVAEFNKTI
jgi:hypothetical protein